MRKGNKRDGTASFDSKQNTCRRPAHTLLISCKGNCNYVNSSSEFQMFVLRTDGEEDAAWFNKPNLRPNRCNAAQLVRFSLFTSHRHIPDETEIVARRKLEQISVTRDRQRLEKITRTVSQASGRPSMPNGEYPSSTERNTTADDGKASQGPILFSLNEPDLVFPMTYVRLQITSGV